MALAVTGLQALHDRRIFFGQARAESDGPESLPIDIGLLADAWRHVNLLAVARLIARAALRREESRGGHFREDFPARDDLHWQVHLIDAQPL